MLMTMPWAGVPVMTPRRPIALVKANVAAERTASTAPKRCTNFPLPIGQRLAPDHQGHDANRLSPLLVKSARLIPSRTPSGHRARLTDRARRP